MPKLMTRPLFDRGRASEAAEFNASVFPDGHVGKARASSVDLPAAKVGEELLVEFTVLGRACVGLNVGPEFNPDEAAGFMVVTETREETDRCWDGIVGNSGRESAGGWRNDRWGFSRQITPRAA